MKHGDTQKGADLSFASVGVNNATNVQFDTTNTDAAAVGNLRWSDADGVLEFGAAGGNVNIQIGQEMMFRAVNKTGVTIADGAVVYVNDAQGNRPTIALAKADSDSTSHGLLGVATENIADNAEGFVTTQGIVRGYNTSGFTDGDTLFLSPSTAGALTATQPTAPNHSVIIAIALNSTVNGMIYVKPNGDSDLVDLHDVSITTPTDGQLLAYEAASGLWKNSAAGLSGSGTQYYLPVWTGATSLGALASLGSAGAVLQSAGAGANPAWSSFLLGGGNAGATYSFPAAASGGIPLVNAINTFTQNQIVQNAVANNVAFVIQGAAAQNQYLLDLRNSGGTSLARFDKDGNITAQSAWTSLATTMYFSAANATTGSIRLNPGVGDRFVISNGTTCDIFVNNTVFGPWGANLGAVIRMQGNYPAFAIRAHSTQTAANYLLRVENSSGVAQVYVTGDYVTKTLGLRQAVTVSATNLTLTANHEVVVFTATATATLPAATGTGQTYRIIARGAGVIVTIDASGSETVKGELTQVINDGEDLIITDTASGLWE